MVLNNILIIFLGLKEIERDEVVKLHLEAICSVNHSHFHPK
jgi:hypothetical protein